MGEEWASRPSTLARGSKVQIERKVEKVVWMLRLPLSVSLLRKNCYEHAWDFRVWFNLFSGKPEYLTRACFKLRLSPL